MTALTLGPAALDRIAPFRLAFDGAGIVRSAGRTAERVAPGMVGHPLDRSVRFLRPAIAADEAHGLAAAALAHGARLLHVELLRERGIRAGEGRSRLRAEVTPLDDGGGLLTLALGADPIQAVRRHRITAQDLATTDPTPQMLFLLEAQGMIRGELSRARARLHAARDSAEARAATDRLTGLRNRRAMDDALAALIQRPGQGFAVMSLDLDHFKAVNDGHGHAAGDHVLREVARILLAQVRRDDVVARVGGDEFVLVFPDCADVEMVEGIARRIVAQLERPIEWRGTACRISASVGITMSCFHDEPDVDRLLAEADAALYASKRAGRARHHVAAPPCDVGDQAGRDVAR